jgi:ABC-type multidrug transport system ATPase subunit
LNILSGFNSNSSDIEGIIKVNGVNYNSSTCKRNATYIMQEENLFPTLTVLEAMEFAVKFKIGNVLTGDECSKKIMKTLMTLGLEGKINDFCGGLSGGQKKRLSIALELVDDPPVLFLDEPVK